MCVAVHVNKKVDVALNNSVQWAFGDDGLMVGLGDISGPFQPE